MSYFSKKNYGSPVSAALQGDVERALVGVRADITAASTYAPGDPASWASPAPTTLADALDRLAAYLATVGGSPVP